jgi:hypothetical protein
MIVVREVFYAKPGQAGKLARLMREVMSEAYPNGNIRIMTDYISEFNKVVMETELANLAAFEGRMAEYRANANEELKAKMAGYTDMYSEGRREIYQIVE